MNNENIIWLCIKNMREFDSVLISQGNLFSKHNTKLS